MSRSSVSPLCWSSVFHSSGDSPLCRLLQPNKSALKRDIFARRRNWGTRRGSDRFVSAAPRDEEERSRCQRRHGETNTEKGPRGESSECTDVITVNIFNQNPGVGSQRATGRERTDALLSHTMSSSASDSSLSPQLCLAAGAWEPLLRAKHNSIVFNCCNSIISCMISCSYHVKHCFTMWAVPLFYLDLSV